MRARFVRIYELIGFVGPKRVDIPQVKHVTGPLWEMHTTGQDSIPHALHVAVWETSIVIVQVFIKKTQQTPCREINLA